MKIALITPEHKEDYLTNTIIDGLLALAETGDLSWAAPLGYQSYLDFSAHQLERTEFVDFARKADLIFLCWGKDNTNLSLAVEINRFDKTIYVDGSEPGGNRRYDQVIQAKILAGDKEIRGAIDRELLAKCSLYFRREQPHPEGIIPLPFGIERRYLSAYDLDQQKDIDFFCIFGQNEFPPLRAEVQQSLQKFCQAHNLKCVTEPTSGFSLSGDKSAGRAEFYQLLARSKVGISVGGGGFDTARFWEILANNCLLLTETLAIYEPGSSELAYQRIWQFKDLTEFEQQLEKMANYLQNEYPKAMLDLEHQEILAKHSTRARVEMILAVAKAKHLIL
ncbi:MAG: hypothetical protein AAB900_03000 [Patescibacteria group bacterium]